MLEKPPKDDYFIALFPVKSLKRVGGDYIFFKLAKIAQEYLEH